MIMNKVCCVSDLHLGCHSDSENWHDITLNWGRWLKNELIEKDIEHIVICGDFFDNRNEIGVKTIAVASELMDIFNDFEVTMITGNHDQFYRNRNDVHSVSIFEGRKNVTVISSIRQIKFGDRKVSFIPWGEDVSKCKKSDIIFGHLEVNGFKMSLGKLAEGKIAPKDLTSKAKLVFSGHFHLRDERKYSASKIIYVGSPYQMNWGEASNMPGYYIVDIDNVSYEFYENTISPKHIKTTSKNLKLKDVKGNILSVEIDPELDDIEIEAIKTKVYNKKPLEVKFNILRKVNTVNDVSYSGNVDVFKVLMGFVDEMDIDEFSEDVKVKLNDLYQKHKKEHL